METETVRNDNGTLLQNSSDAVFKNSLIVREICSFTSGADLLSLRVVSSLFHREATKQLKTGHQPIDLLQESSVNKFLDLMRTRLNPEEVHSFPFSGFKIDVRNSEESFERFVADAGQHVERLIVEPSQDRTVPEWDRRVISLICRTPNLAQVDLDTHNALRVFNSDLVSFPKSFPRLSRIGINYYYAFNRDYGNPASVTLLSLLISRAPGLKELGMVRVQFEDKYEGLGTLRGLVQHHAHCVPIIYHGVVRSKYEIPVLQELRNMNLRFKNLEIEIGRRKDENLNQQPNGEAFQNLWQNFSDFLTTQSSCLQRLKISTFFGFQQPPRSLTLALPPLAALKEFQFRYDFGHDSETMSVSIPLVANQFPTLRSFQLSIFDPRGDAIIMTFGTNPQPSVQEFDFRCTLTLLERNPWHQIFPNLRTLSLHLLGFNLIYNRQNLAYILKHFPLITSLELHFVHHRRDFWDILTGASPRRPVSIEAYGVLEQPPSELEAPVDGVFQIPSLGNLRVLQTLICRPGSRANLKAIWYMTRMGRLGPLNRLVLTGLAEDLGMKVDEKSIYQDLFAQFHGSVCLLDRIPLQMNRLIPIYNSYS